MNNGLPGLGYISHLQTSQTNIWVTCLSLTHPLHGNPHPAGSVSELELHSFQWLQHSQIQGLPGPVVTASDLGAGAGSRVDSHPGWSPERAPWSCGSTWRGRGATGSALGTQCTEGLGAGRSEWGTKGVLCSPLATFCSRLRQLQIIWLGQREKREQHPLWVTDGPTAERTGQSLSQPVRPRRGQCPTCQWPGVWAQWRDLLILSALGSAMRHHSFLRGCLGGLNGL